MVNSRNSDARQSSLPTRRNVTHPNVSTHFNHDSSLDSTSSSASSSFTPWRTLRRSFSRRDSLEKPPSSPLLAVHSPATPESSHFFVDTPESFLLEPGDDTKTRPISMPMPINVKDSPYSRREFKEPAGLSHSLPDSPFDIGEISMPMTTSLSASTSLLKRTLSPHRDRRKSQVDDLDADSARSSFDELTPPHSPYILHGSSTAASSPRLSPYTASPSAPASPSSISGLRHSSLFVLPGAPKPSSSGSTRLISNSSNATTPRPHLLHSSSIYSQSSVSEMLTDLDSDSDSEFNSNASEYGSIASDDDASIATGPSLRHKRSFFPDMPLEASEGLLSCTFLVDDSVPDFHVKQTTILELNQCKETADHDMRRVLHKYFDRHRDEFPQINTIAEFIDMPDDRSSLRMLGIRDATRDVPSPLPSPTILPPPVPSPSRSRRVSEKDSMAHIKEEREEEEKADKENVVLAPSTSTSSQASVSITPSSSSEHYSISHRPSWDKMQGQLRRHLMSSVSPRRKDVIGGDSESQKELQEKRMLHSNSWPPSGSCMYCVIYLCAPYVWFIIIIII